MSKQDGIPIRTDYPNQRQAQFIGSGEYPASCRTMAGRNQQKYKTRIKEKNKC